MNNDVVDVYWELVAVKTDWLEVLQFITKWLALGALIGYYIAHLTRGG